MQVQRLCEEGIVPYTRYNHTQFTIAEDGGSAIVISNMGICLLSELFITLVHYFTSVCDLANWICTYGSKMD